jgi:hypothetical protein
MKTFTVALMGPPFFGTPDMWLGAQFADEDMDGPYEPRPKVAVEADEDETLDLVINRAADRLGIRPNPSVLGQTAMSASIGGIAFYYAPTDEAAYQRDRAPWAWPDRLVILDPSGKRTVKPWQEVTVRELLAASEEGLLYGDPLRPYLYPGFPQGDILGPDWLPPVVDAATKVVEFAKGHAPTSPGQAADDAIRGYGVFKIVKAAWGRWRPRRRHRSKWDDS